MNTIYNSIIQKLFHPHKRLYGGIGYLLLRKMNKTSKFENGVGYSGVNALGRSI